MENSAEENKEMIEQELEALRMTLNSQEYQESIEST